MDHDPRAYLWDAREGADAIESFVRRRTFEDYHADMMLRSAVERQFEIIGEALRRLEKAAPDLAAKLPERSQAIAFRNILIHDDAIVWRAIHEACRPCSRASQHCSTRRETHEGQRFFMSRN